jgi:hypothetical protein
MIRRILSRIFKRRKRCYKCLDDLMDFLRNKHLIILYHVKHQKNPDWKNLCIKELEGIFKYLEDFESKK